ncbi:LysR family transcriptional regulator [Marinomonas rhizomae]|uniref:LysR family transcriptional regulator n=1 Tax=Marinomonas rhizomae TaxID=491948 RepID=UPI002104D2FE|nr:LysR family transcriptional regulator [Marinomonas rhizomae]UTV99866.1 LysR family transcriptional regulator [Marinomonas rhizomae]
MKFNYSLDDMRCFCAVAQHGSFKQASAVLEMPLSTLSRRVAKLEEDLAIRLLNRDAHRVQLTHSGQRYFERSASLFEELDDVAVCLLQDNTQAKGTIRVSAPVNFGVHVLAQHFNAFLIEYPDIHLDLRLSNQNIDIEEEAIDIAFRVGDHNAVHWIGRHLTNIRFVICGSVHLDLSSINTPRDLEGFPTVLCAPISTWKLQHTTSGEILSHKPNHNIRLKVDDISLLTRAIQDGLGIGFMPDYHAQPLIDLGEIRQVLPEWSNQARGCQMLYRDRDNMPFRLRLLIDFMLKRFNDHPLYE